MSTDEFAPLTPEELATEGVTALPDKEVVSILDLAADIDLAIDGAAPIDLAVALNANVVAPIAGAVSAPTCSPTAPTRRRWPTRVSRSTRHVDADAIATGIQDSTIDQSDTVTGGADAAPADGTGRDAGRRHARRPTRRCWLRPTPPTLADAAGAAADARPSTARWSWTPPATSSARSTRATGNVVDSAGNIIGTLNETTGLVVDTAGNIVGTVTDLVDGASVVGRDRQRHRRPRRRDRERARRLRQRRRGPRPADRPGPQHGGRRARHRDRPDRRHHRAGRGRQRRRCPRRCDRQRRRRRRQRDRRARPADRPGPRRRRQHRRHGRPGPRRRHRHPRPAQHRRPAQGRPAQRRRQRRPGRRPGGADQRRGRGQRQRGGADRRGRVGQHPLRRLAVGRDRAAGRDHHTRTSPGPPRRPPTRRPAIDQASIEPPDTDTASADDPAPHRRRRPGRGRPPAESGRTEVPATR